MNAGGARPDQRERQLAPARDAEREPQANRARAIIATPIVRARETLDWMPSDEELDEAATIPKGAAIAEAQRLMERKIRARPERPRSAA